MLRGGDPGDLLRPSAAIFGTPSATSEQVVLEAVVADAVAVQEVASCRSFRREDVRQGKHDRDVGARDGAIHSAVAVHVVAQRTERDDRSAAAPEGVERAAGRMVAGAAGIDAGVLERDAAEATR